MVAPFSIRVFVKSCIACKFIQNSGLVSKNRARRKAMSAVTERSPFTIAPMRVAGTRKAIASALIDNPRGLRNSSFSTSPGCAGTRLGVAMVLVVVDDFDIGGSFLGSRRNGETRHPILGRATALESDEPIPL